MTATGGAGGGAGTPDGGDAGAVTGNDAGGSKPVTPDPPAQCPEIATGTITVMDQDVELWVGPSAQPGPLVFYWHGTGSNANEITSLWSPAFQAITADSGVIASFTTTTGVGQNTGNGVWYTGDFAMADIILACAAEQGLVDTRRIFVAGCSAGGLQAVAMAYERSSYVAATLPNSGGLVSSYQLEDPSHVPAVMSTHGGEGIDMVIIDFAQATATLTADMASKGAFVVNCDHGGGHCQSPSSVREAQWEFALAHPFGVDPSPYESDLPPSFPMFCATVLP